MWTYFWDVKSFPDCLRRFYEKHERDEMELENKNQKTESLSPPSRKTSTTLIQTKKQLQRQSSVMDCSFNVLSKTNKSEDTDCNSDENKNKKFQTDKKNFEKAESIV